MRIIAGTGHRPDKLGGYDERNPTAKWIRSQLRDIVVRSLMAGWRDYISGGALGFDQWLAEIVLELGGNLTIARPFPEQHIAWPEYAQRRYMDLLNRCQSGGGQVIDVSQGSYSPQKMQIRNQYMVDSADVVLACWDGSPGGTGNCIQYAMKKNRNIYRIDPLGKTVGWME